LGNVAFLCSQEESIETFIFVSDALVFHVTSQYNLPTVHTYACLPSSIIKAWPGAKVVRWEREIDLLTIQRYLLFILVLLTFETDSQYRILIFIIRIMGIKSSN
jgi:sugar phosphate permease